MNVLARCPECNGFVPVGSNICPNCEHAPANAGGRLGRVAKACLMVATGGTMAVTLMACYGGPPHAYETYPATPSGCEANEQSDPRFASAPTSPGDPNRDCTPAPANTLATGSPAPGPAPEPAPP